MQRGGWRGAGRGAQALDRARPTACAAVYRFDLGRADGRGSGADVRDGMRNDDKRVVRNRKHRFGSTVEDNN